MTLHIRTTICAFLCMLLLPAVCVANESNSLPPPGEYEGDYGTLDVRADNNDDGKSSASLWDDGEVTQTIYFFESGNCTISDEFGARHGTFEVSVTSDECVKTTTITIRNRKGNVVRTYTMEEWVEYSECIGSAHPLLR